MSLLRPAKALNPCWDSSQRTLDYHCTVLESTKSPIKKHILLLVSITYIQIHKYCHSSNFWCNRCTLATVFITDMVKRVGGDEREGGGAMGSFCPVHNGCGNIAWDCVLLAAMLTNGVVHTRQESAASSACCGDRYDQFSINFRQFCTLGGREVTQRYTGNHFDFQNKCTFHNKILRMTNLHLCRLYFSVSCNKHREKREQPL